MHPFKAIKASFSLRLSLKVLVLVALVTAVSGSALYIFMERVTLPASYGGTVAGIAGYKAMVLKKSALIYALFTLLMLTGVTLVGVVYSHRVAGPLERVKAAARELAKRNFGADVRFRKHDVVHPLAESLNRMTGRYKARHARLLESAKLLEEGAHALEAAIKSHDKAGMERAMDSLASASASAEKALSELKL